MSGSLVLVGLSGSGKSTVGKHAASALSLPFYDTDRMIETITGRSVADIFNFDGEAEFRRIEASVVATAVLHPGVVATGGGLVLSQQNRQLIRRENLVLWLDPPIELLVQRLQDHSTGEERPLLSGNLHDRLRTLSTARQAAYQEAAHLRLGDEVLHEGSSADIAAEVIRVFLAWCTATGYRLPATFKNESD